MYSKWVLLVFYAENVWGQRQWAWSALVLLLLFDWRGDTAAENITFSQLVDVEVCILFSPWTSKHEIKVKNNFSDVDLWCLVEAVPESKSRQQHYFLSLSPTVPLLINTGRCGINVTHKRLPNTYVTWYGNFLFWTSPQRWSVHVLRWSKFKAYSLIITVLFHTENHIFFQMLLQTLYFPKLLFLQIFSLITSL